MSGGDQDVDAGELHEIKSGKDRAVSVLLLFGRSSNLNKSRA